MTVLYPSLLETMTYGSPGWHSLINSGFQKLNTALHAGAVSQLPIADRDLTAPPGSPAENDRYIVGASATGDWSGQDGKIAHYNAGNGWSFIAPFVGMTVFVEDEEISLIYKSGAWEEFGSSGGDTSELEEVLTEMIVSGRYYDSNSFEFIFPARATNGSEPSDPSYAYFIPFWAGYEFSPVAIHVEVTTARTNGKIRLAIADNLAGVANDKLWSSALIDASTTGDKEEVVSATTMRGWNHLGIAANDSLIAVRCFYNPSGATYDEDHTSPLGKPTGKVDFQYIANAGEYNFTFGPLGSENDFPSNFVSSFNAYTRMEAPIISLKA